MQYDVRNLIYSFEIPKTEFTKLIKEFQKANGGRYSFRLNKQDAKLIFFSAMDFINSDNSSDEARYNALRLVKFSFSDETTFRENFEKIIALYLYSLTHKYGNIRLEAVNIQNEILLQLSGYTQAHYGKKITKEIKEKHDYYRPIIIELNFLLIQMNYDYEKEHKKELYKRELSTKTFITHSLDTEDKFLKSIRRAIEGFDYPYIQEKMRKFGYIE